MQLFMAFPVTPSAAMSDFSGRRYHRFDPFNLLLSLAAPHLHGVLVLGTGDTPARNYLSVLTTVLLCRGSCFLGYTAENSHHLTARIISKEALF
jgi:hypothetical protein